MKYKDIRKRTWQRQTDRINSSYRCWCHWHCMKHCFKVRLDLSKQLLLVIKSRGSLLHADGTRKTNC